MGELLILGLALLGLVAPLLPRWRAAVAATLLFIAANWVMLGRIDSVLATDPAPGPGARGVILLAYLPTAAFVVACCLRALVEAVRLLVRRLRGRGPG